ncbi:MAG: phage portal protein [Bacteroidales bacterium]|nr:phage portal protein [Bacteroidales bacterium]
MSLLSRMRTLMKSLRPGPEKPLPARVGPLFAAPFGSSAGWWRDDPSEQLRNYQSWVYAAVNAIAQEVARQRPYLFVNTGQADHEQVPLSHTHPLCRLLDRPNPWLTPWEMWYLTVVYLELTGNCFWYIADRTPEDRRFGTPAEIWIVPTPWVKVEPDAREFVKAYTIAAPGVPGERFTPNEIIHLKYPNPLDPHYGLSPLQANALTVDANTELLKSRYQTFLAGPRPGVVLQTDQMLTDQSVRRLEDTLTDKFAGRTNWHRPMVLEQGLKASPWTLTPAEMDYMNSAKMTRDEILALFRVPPPITGLVENIGLGGQIWSGSRVMFCEGTIQPKLELMAQALTRDLGCRYGPDVVITFPDCSPRNQEERRKDDEVDAKLGIRTYNEIRRGRGLQPFADPRFDQPMVPGTE